ncbi:hypothetical protein GOP47_0027384 [Adiantum capillus-veneris]|nr:hypothetical protein GOP47_0027384 [Adiantum capillus-veneris]
MASMTTLPLGRLPNVAAENLAFFSSLGLSKLQIFPLSYPSKLHPPCLQAPIAIVAAAAVAVPATASKSKKGKSQENEGIQKVRNATNHAQPKLQSFQPLPVQRIIRERKAAASAKGTPRFSKAARRFYNETFRQPQRLSKVLAAAGVASRRACEELIFEAKVTVNGEICKVPQTMVDPLKDIIYVDGQSLPKKLAPKLYFVLNKPKGYICSSREEDEKSVLTLFDDYMKIWVQRNPGVPKPRLFTVGRLDVATTGLLFVTNDGEFAHHVSHPSSGLTKEYIATIEGKVTKRQLQTIADGTEVQEVPCVPKSVEVMDGEPGENKTRLKIVVSEGRNHEVRHLIENAGLDVQGLKRVRIGNYRLPRTLGIGKHLLLTEANMRNAQLMGQPKMDEAKQERQRSDVLKIGSA